MGRKPKSEHDFAINAFRVVQEATGQIEPKPETKTAKSFDAKALGHLGGLKGVESHNLLTISILSSLRFGLFFL